jgi:hypothetical protein
MTGKQPQVLWTDLKEHEHAAEHESKSLGALLDEHAGTYAADGTEGELVRLHRRRRRRGKRLSTRGYEGIQHSAHRIRYSMLTGFTTDLRNPCSLRSTQAEQTKTKRTDAGSTPKRRRLRGGSLRSNSRVGESTRTREGHVCLLQDTRRRPRRRRERRRSGERPARRGCTAERASKNRGEDAGHSCLRPTKGVRGSVYAREGNVEVTE